MLKFCVQEARERHEPALFFGSNRAEAGEVELGGR